MCLMVVGKQALQLINHAAQRCHTALPELMVRVLVVVAVAVVLGTVMQESKPPIPQVALRGLEGIKRRPEPLVRLGCQAWHVAHRLLGVGDEGPGLLIALLQGLFIVAVCGCAASGV